MKDYCEYRRKKDSPNKRIFMYVSSKYEYFLRYILNMPIKNFKEYVSSDVFSWEPYNNFKEKQCIFARFLSDLKIIELDDSESHDLELKDMDKLFVKKYKNDK